MRRRRSPAARGCGCLPSSCRIAAGPFSRRGLAFGRVVLLVALAVARAHLAVAIEDGAQDADIGNPQPVAAELGVSRWTRRARRQRTTPSTIEPIRMASVTASVGAVSMTTKSNCAPTNCRNSRMRSEDSSSDGFGAIGPDGREEEVARCRSGRRSCRLRRCAGEEAHQTEPCWWLEDLVLAGLAQVAVDQQHQLAELCASTTARLAGGRGLAVATAPPR